MITIKEEFVGGDKWKRAVALAGSDAIVLWLAMKHYVAVHLTNGFVPGDEVRALPGAPAKARRALDALLGCGRLRPDGSRGAGLVDEHPHGWQLHDYLDHANSADKEMDRRRKERDRKASYRAGQGGVSRGTTDGTPDVTDVSARMPQSQPNPIPDPLPDPEPARAAAAAGVLEPIENRSRAVPCPPDLDERLVKLGVHLELAQHLKCEPESVVAELKAFRDTWVAGKLAGQSRSHWAGKARQWVIDQHRQGRLKPPGEIEHLERQPDAGQTRRAKAAKEASSKGMALMREAQALAAAGGK